MQWHRYQNQNGREFDGDAYNVFASEVHVIQPWQIPVGSVLNLKDVCARYKTQDRSIVRPEGPSSNDLQTTIPRNNGTIRQPGVGENWLNNTGVNLTIAKEVLSLY
jgi:hypothetical protein